VASRLCSVVVVGLLALVAAQAADAGTTYVFGLGKDDNGAPCPTSCGAFIHGRESGITIPGVVTGTRYSCGGFTYNFGHPFDNMGCHVITPNFGAYGTAGTYFDVWVRKPCPTGGGYEFSPTYSGRLSNVYTVLFIGTLQVQKPAGGCHV
jgi:hypothetical protein